MTQYPGPDYTAPNPAYFPYAIPAPARPTAVTVLAIFGIIFGIIGLLIKACGVAVMFIPQMANAPGMEFQKDMLAWTVATTPPSGWQFPSCCWRARLARCRSSRGRARRCSPTRRWRS